MAGDDTASREGKETVASMGVATGVHGKVTGGAECHGVVMLLMSVDIVTESKPAMLLVVHSEAGDQGTGTEGLGEALFGWEDVQPEDTTIDQF